MRAFLLAAGEGRRLRPLTERVPKCLVPIRDTPLLGWWLRLLGAHGVTDVLVNARDLAAAVEAFARAWPTPISITTVHEPELLGSAGTVLANRDFIPGGEPFLVVYADNLSAMDVGRMARFHASRQALMTVGIAPTDRPREKGTVVVDEQWRIVAFDEKVDQPRSNLANAGIYVASHTLLDELPALAPSGAFDFGFHVLPRLVKRLAAYPITEFMMDIGTPDAYAVAQDRWPGLPSSG